MSEVESRPRVRPITATEVARKLMERPSAHESVTLKRNAKGEVQPEVTGVRQDGETLYDCGKRVAAVLNWLDDEYRMPSRADYGENGDEDTTP